MAEKEDLCKPSCSKDISCVIDQSFEHSNKSKKSTDLLQILETVIKCLKSNEKDTILILKSFLNINEKYDEKQTAVQKLISTILVYSKSSSLAELNKLYADLNDLILSDNLTDMVLDKNDFSQMMAIDMGGCSIIYSGFLNKNGIKVKVAIKQSMPQTKKLLKHEANILSELNHPNIVKMLGIFKEPFSLVMEYLPKKNLVQALTTKVYTNEDMLKALLEIACGMEYLAAHKIVHRDLALQNILVDEKYHCKLGDFGFSCYVDKVGTPSDPMQDFNTDVNRNAPEIVIAKDYTIKSDVFSMGLLMIHMYELSENRLTSDFVKYFLKQLHGLPKPNKMPATLHEFIKSGLLNINPERRPTFTKIKEVVSNLLH